MALVEEPARGPDAPQLRPGWLAERLRRWLLRLLKGDFDRLDGKVSALEARLQTHAGLLAATDERTVSLQRSVGAVEQRLDALAGVVAPLGSGELQRHLETRIDQTLAELADLRGAYLATRGEFETFRDETLPAATREVERVHGAVVVVQDEIEALRKDRLSRNEQDIARLQGAVEAVQRGLEEVAGVRLAQAETGMAQLHEAVEAVQRELQETRELRLARHEEDLARLQRAVDAVQTALEAIASERLASVDRDLGALHKDLVSLQRLAEELRDERLPALAGRTDALLEQLHLELTEVSGLVDRIAAGEPIHVTADPAAEMALPAAVTAAAPAFVEGLRGERAEILDRVSAYVPLLAGCAPVLDVGCGRGELLEALQQQGIAARGIDSDPAMVAACRRRGLAAETGELPAALAALGEASVGAVTAIHVLEHLPAAGWMAVVEAARRVLRAGGLLLAECPNPDTLRVGGGLYWSDPTHRSPVHPRALELVARALGFEIVEVRFLRPFPVEQKLASPRQSEEVRQLAQRLDEWLSGPRDFLLVARKP